MTGRNLKPLTKEELEELRRIRSGLDKILAKNIHNPIVKDMKWMLELLEKFE